MMAAHAEDGLHPEELSRRISEIDLTNLRRRADTATSNPPRYTQADLLKLRPSEKDGAHFTAAEFTEGITTPTDFPAPPPPTPDHLGSADDHESVDDNSHAVQAPVEAAKKKKKKSGGKNKKAASTGFEG
jgi:hypothetical protein